MVQLKSKQVKIPYVLEHSFFSVFSSNTVKSPKPLAGPLPSVHLHREVSVLGENSEFTQRDGRKKRTAKRLCVTNVTGLLLGSFVVVFPYH